jgi:hypothetical protein
MLPAAVLDVSVETVTRDWRLARGWLLLRIKGTDSSDERDFGHE